MRLYCTKSGTFCLLMLLLFVLCAVPAQNGYAISAPRIFVEAKDYSEYEPNTEKATIHDNGEKVKKTIQIIAANEINALSWKQVKGAEYYLMAIRDVDKDKVVLENTRLNAKDNWCDVHKLLEEKTLRYGVNYKLAVGAYDAGGEYRWSEPFYFRLEKSKKIIVGGSFSKSSITLEIGHTTRLAGEAWAQNGTLGRVTYTIEGYQASSDGNNRYCTQVFSGKKSVDLLKAEDLVLDAGREPLNREGTYTVKMTVKDSTEQVWTEADTIQVKIRAPQSPDTITPPPPPEEIKVGGSFSKNSITMEIGHTTRLAGEAWAQNGTLGRVTYTIEGYQASSDGNNRYCTQVFSGKNSVDLLKAEDLVLDAGREPLNREGTYTVKMTVKDSTEMVWSEADTIQVKIRAPQSPDTITPPPPPKEIKVGGSFSKNSITMEIGQTTRLAGEAWAQNGTLGRVTYTIEGYQASSDGNNRYCTQVFRGKKEVDLSKAEDLVLDAGREPLNREGTYTVKMTVKDSTEQVWTEADTIQVKIRTPQSPDTITPPPPPKEIKVGGSFSKSSITLEIGQTTRLAGEAWAQNGTLGRVTYTIEGYQASSDGNNRYCTQVFRGKKEVDLSKAEDLVLDAGREPLNREGTYTVKMTVKDSTEQVWIEADTIQVKIRAPQSTDTITPPPPPKEIKVGGSFSKNSITMEIGQTTRLAGEAWAQNGTLGRVTYTIEGYQASSDGNNRYCTQVFSGKNSVDLLKAEDLVLDAGREPLNREGTYTIKMTVKDSTELVWAETDKIQVKVLGLPPTEVPEPYINIIEPVGDVTVQAGTPLEIELDMQNIAAIVLIFNPETKDWKHIEKNNTITITLFSPGNYTLRVYGGNMADPKQAGFEHDVSDNVLNITVTAKETDSEMDDAITSIIKAATSQAELWGKGLDDFTSDQRTEARKKYRKAAGVQDGDDWCASFIVWCAKEAKISDKSGIHSRAAGAGVKDAAQKHAATCEKCKTNISWGYLFFVQGHEKTEKGFTPRAGDLVFFMWAPNENHKNDENDPHPSWHGNADHVGLITAVNGDGSFSFIHGNTTNDRIVKLNKSSDSMKDKTFMHFVCGYGRPYYDKAYLGD